MRSPNRLINEISPYLIQHARNPVDWYPWGEEAIEKARAEDKPIFLSIGYSACHWCHVMAHESFENDSIAEILNEFYIPIKVDREERPDLDEIYMDAVQLMSGNGGWPMSVFLDTNLKPFFGGTYFPPENRRGRKGFRDLLMALAKIWESDRQYIENATMEIFAGMSSSETERLCMTPIGLADVEKKACETQAAGFDPENGGFGGAPKFPPALQILSMLNWEKRHRDGRYAHIIDKTLAGMACGGIHDHVGGGFCRYSVDEKWHLPHFEKMLTDNALLSLVYLRAYELTGNVSWRRIAERTLDYLLRDMMDETGGFFSSSDADSDGREGVYYLWTADELKQAASDDWTVFSRHFRVLDDGNFVSGEPYHRNLNILHASEIDPPESLVRVIEKLAETRARRIAPQIDNKVITSWNGLLIESLAVAGRLTGETRFLTAAERAANFILQTMLDGDMLHRIYRSGSIRQAALLEDWVFSANGFFSLYDATHDKDWLLHAQKFADTIWTRFQQNGVLYISEADVPYNIVRKQSMWDSVIPSGASATARLLFNLAERTGRKMFRERLDSIMTAYGNILMRVPGAMCAMTDVAGSVAAWQRDDSPSEDRA